MINKLPGLVTYSQQEVLLRERKRHTARRVVSTPSVVLPGYPPPGGVTWPRYPPQGGVWVPPRGRGVPDPGTPPPKGWGGVGGTWPGYPRGGRGTPRGRGVPDPGTPPGGGGYLTRVPPRGGGGVPDPGTPPGGFLTRDPPGGFRVPPGGGSGNPPHCLMAFWEMLQSIMGYGYPPPRGQTESWMDRRVSKHYLPPSFGCGR